jgi:hypothetical protein
MKRIEKFYNQLAKSRYSIEALKDIKKMYVENNIFLIKDNDLCYELLDLSLDLGAEIAITDLKKSFNSVHKVPVDENGVIDEPFISNLNDCKDLTDLLVMFNLLRAHEYLNVEDFDFSSSVLVKDWLNERVVSHIINKFKDDVED